MRLEQRLGDNLQHVWPPLRVASLVSGETRNHQDAANIGRGFVSQATCGLSRACLLIGKLGVFSRPCLELPLQAA